MKALLLLTLIAAAGLLAGCATPIKTTVDYSATAEGLPELSYSSEKDIRYKREVVGADGSTELVEFEALASDPALAAAKAIQAQGEAIRALSETRPAQAATEAALGR